MIGENTVHKQEKQQHRGEGLWGNVIKLRY